MGSSPLPEHSTVSTALSESLPLYSDPQAVQNVHTVFLPDIICHLCPLSSVQHAGCHFPCSPVPSTSSSEALGVSCAVAWNASPWVPARLAPSTIHTLVRGLREPFPSHVLRLVRDLRHPVPLAYTTSFYFFLE